MGHAARQLLAARLVPVRRLVHHHRAAAVHAAGRAVRAAHRHRPYRRGDDVHPGGGPGRAAGPRRPGAGAPRRGPGADAADGRPGVRPPARRRRLRRAAVPRPPGHGRAAAADLAGPRPVPGRAGTPWRPPGCCWPGCSSPTRWSSWWAWCRWWRCARCASPARSPGARTPRPRRPAVELVRAVPGGGGHRRPGRGLAGRAAAPGLPAPGALPAGPAAHLAQARLRDREGPARAVRGQARGAARRAGLRAAAPGRGGPGRLGRLAGGAALLALARPDQPGPAPRDGGQRGRVRAEHASQRDRPERAGVRRGPAVRGGPRGPDTGARPAREQPGRPRAAVGRPGPAGRRGWPAMRPASAGPPPSRPSRR